MNTRIDTRNDKPIAVHAMMPTNDVLSFLPKRPFIIVPMIGNKSTYPIKSKNYSPEKPGFFILLPLH
jgi:hypothetical protein